MLYVFDQKITISALLCGIYIKTAWSHCHWKALRLHIWLGSNSSLIATHSACMTGQLATLYPLPHPWHSSTREYQVIIIFVVHNQNQRIPEHITMAKDWIHRALFSLALGQLVILNIENCVMFMYFGFCLLALFPKFLSSRAKEKASISPFTCPPPPLFHKFDMRLYVCMDFFWTFVLLLYCNNMSNLLNWKTIVIVFAETILATNYECLTYLDSLAWELASIKDKQSFKICYL